MTVIAFQSKVLQSDGPWRPAELKALVESLAPDSPHAGARHWDVGITEIGDPQFYLLGAPDDECILCISRLGRLYVLEDGAGKLLFEHNSLLALAEHLGLKYYTFVSQVENGFGRVPTDSMEAWARALAVEPSAFARRLLSFYDPELHRLLFEVKE